MIWGACVKCNTVQYRVIWEECAVHLNCHITFEHLLAGDYMAVSLPHAARVHRLTVRCMRATPEQCCFFIGGAFWSSLQALCFRTCVGGFPASFTRTVLPLVICAQAPSFSVFNQRIVSALLTKTSCPWCPGPGHWQRHSAMRAHVTVRVTVRVLPEYSDICTKVA